MSDDLISREALRRRMYHEAFETDNGMQKWDSGLWIRYKIFENAIEEAPAVEPERKKGKWIWVDGVRCSNCNHKLQSTGLPSVCPNCGSRNDTFDFVKEET